MAGARRGADMKAPPRHADERRPVIAAADALSPFGLGLDALWHGTSAAQTAIDKVDRFATERFTARQAALVAGLNPTAADSLVVQMLQRLIPRPAFPPDAALLLATTVGEIDLMEKSVLRRQDDGQAGRPDLFLERVLHRIWPKRDPTGAQTPARIVSAACASSSLALAEAASMIRGGEHEAVLVLACDSVTEFVFSGFSALMALDPQCARPFDLSRKGLTLGEAAAWALVASAERARRENWPVLGAIAGYASACDAHHMTGPARDGDGLARAIEQALRLARREPSAVAAIAAHGTGTIYNDSMEMQAFQRVFQDAPRPVFSVKGAIGHTLGAAGLLEALLALRCLREKCALPTAGLQDPDPAARGWVAATPAPLPARKPCILSTNSGFGGLNTALVLELCHEHSF
jgi:3-oxoacyl-[acyl-carrier-protein] synthase II